jgi:hypothetical protein
MQHVNVIIHQRIIMKKIEIKNKRATYPKRMMIPITYKMWESLREMAHKEKISMSNIMRVCLAKEIFNYEKTAKNSYK